MTNVERALVLANSFEAEVFVHLLLGRWNHPLTDDADFRESLLESATLAIRASMDGESLLEPLKSQDLNFIAALWFAEWSTLQSLVKIPFCVELQGWLDSLRRSLPSCFCDPADLI